jgi:N-acetylmuramic acid 6-phosphate etherase
MDRRQALLQAVADVCRSCEAFPQCLAGYIGETGAAPGAAAVDPEQHQLWFCLMVSAHQPINAQNSKRLMGVSDEAGAAPMDTERPSPRYADIDVWEPADILEAMIGGQFSAVAAVRAALPEIERAALGIEERLKRNGRLIYAGAGTSGRLAVQDGAELMPTFSWPRERLLLLIAGGEEAMVRAVEGAEDETARAGELVKYHRINADDVLVAVAASGTTPFTLSCLREAKRCCAFTIGIANNRGTPILDEAEQAIFLNTGAEPIAGSTRMNAGTAQRITLNLLSTLVMIRLGHVYRGLMVDVQAANIKLSKRKAAMVSFLTGRSEREAEVALAQARGSVKVAVLVVHGCDAEDAATVLQRAGGRLRTAIDLLSDRGSFAPTAKSRG